MDIFNNDHGVPVRNPFVSVRGFRIPIAFPYVLFSGDFHLPQYLFVASHKVGPLYVPTRRVVGGANKLQSIKLNRSGPAASNAREIHPNCMKPSV
jgi:hypothetical protein